MDISLYYQSYGNGFPLVLLHGNGGDSNYFAQQVPYFSRFRRVIALDTRGHGKSPRGTAPFSIRQFAEDLLAKKNVLVCQGGCFQQDKSFRIGYGFGDVEYFKEGLALLGEYLKELEQ